MSADDVEIVIPLCRHANQNDPDLPEEAIEEGITCAALRAFMGGVIQFNGRHDPRRFGAVENEIDVLLADAIGVTSLPIGIITGNDIGKANLARNLIAIGDERIQDTEERRLILGQQEMPWSIPNRLLTLAPASRSSP